MGTNFYHYAKAPCECCGRPFEAVHIGKSSAGWCFALHVDDEIRTLEDWKQRWASGGEIRNEYGDAVTTEEMLSIITERRWKKADDRWWQTFYKSAAEFYEQNQAEPGPNDLCRHRIGRHCVRHGEGTFDYMVGEFS